MAEKRMISKSISISEKVNSLPDYFDMLLFTWMIPHSDDFGRLMGESTKVKALVIPLLSRTVREVSDSLQRLHDSGLIVWYTVDSGKFIQIVKFEDHQTGLHKRTKSRFPEVPGISRKVPEIPGQENGREEKRTEEKGTEQNGSEEIPHTQISDINKVKDDLRDLCNSMKIQGFTNYNLDIVYSYLGVADVKVIEAIIKKSEKKPHTYLTNTLNGMINVDRITRAEQLPGAKGGEADAQHEGSTQGVRPGGYTPTSASESITGGQLGWVGKNRGNVVPLPNVQG
ncbi:hypothetical protein [Cohnella sp. GCM10027633]|uniref:hypothetical protein n=1 Tax=unclassified Cohnella TaxID=2636738 RepID=UPI00363BE486